LKITKIYDIYRKYRDIFDIFDILIEPWSCVNVYVFVCLCVRWCGSRYTAQIVKALYDFDPIQKGDLAFFRGDKMKVLQSDNASV